MKLSCLGGWTTEIGGSCIIIIMLLVLLCFFWKLRPFFSQTLLCIVSVLWDLEWERRAVSESRLFTDRSSVLSSEHGKIEIVWHWELN